MSLSTPMFGFLNLLKPPGMTSSGAVCEVKRYLKGEKIGHAGTLDPEAAGVLPLSIGKATRLFDYLQDKEKAYIAEIAFTGSTDTEDAQGSLLSPCLNPPEKKDVLRVLPSFIGEIRQRPPAFSALKQNGSRSYQLARKGELLQLPERKVTVHSLRYLSPTEREGHLLYVRCSKGFYVRSLCRDIGERLNAPAHMRFLLRVQSGYFRLEEAHTLEEVRSAGEAGRLDSLLIPAEKVFSHFPAAELPEGLEKHAFNGVPLPWRAFEALQGGPAEEGASILLFYHGELLGIAKKEDGLVRFVTWLYR